MSADRQRLQAAIQRIAKQDPDLSALIGAAKNRGGQSSSTGVGISDAERDNLCCNGTTGSGANAGSDTRDPDEDGEDGLDSDDPANLTMGQGSLTGITDCATGEPLCFDGGGWVPPGATDLSAAWDSPTDPPPELGYEDGHWWKYIDLDGFEAAASSATSACKAIGDPRGWTLTSIVFFSETSAECRYELDNSTGGTSRQDCITNPKDACDDPAPLETSWPSDSCTNLAIYGGKIVGSKFDPENDGSYSAPRDELEVCDAAGNRILLRGSPPGGWKSIKSLEGDIDPDTGNGYLYRPNGQRVRQISPSEFRDDAV